MTKHREILRLKSLGFSERNIAQSCGVSRNTVAKVLKKAAEIKLSWPLNFDMTDSALEELMFPKDNPILLLQHILILYIASYYLIHIFLFFSSIHQLILRQSFLISSLSERFTTPNECPDTSAKIR